ncbi:MAG: calcium/sodium antiporter [Methanophagales archaeon ANME-1-THS]|nr:MAG: calcium/sodium antiporter [Methanophagales archaeon ANME-1-THS]
MVVEPLVNFGLLIVSLAVLILIADHLIDHSVKLAALFGVSEAVIGLTVLSYGTSMPEFAVSSIASIQVHDQLSVSNIIGSNIYNIAMVLGLVAVLAPFSWRDDLRRDGLFMTASTFALVLFAFRGGISSLIGVAMAITLAGYTYYVIRSCKGAHADQGLVKSQNESPWKEIGWCALLLAGVLVAGSATVHFAVQTARSAGVSEWLIGATIVAAGTSLPETVVSVISAKKGQMGMSLGNLVGSNYFNILWILGFAAALGPLSLSIEEIWGDLVFLCMLTVLFFIVLVRKSIGNYEGVAYLGIYTLYLLYLLKILPF